MDGLAVRRDGEPGGPTVIVVHGTMDRAAGFRRSVRRTHGLDVVLYDRRGYAASRSAGLSPSIGAQVQDLSAVVSWAGDGPVVVVGHSLGGLIGAHLSINEPARVAALGLWEPPMPWLEWYTSSAGEGALRIGQLRDGSAAAEFFLRAMVGDRIWERMPPSMRAERLAEGPALLADLDLCRRPEARFDPADLRCPVVIGCGSESHERFRRSAALLAEEVPGAVTFEIPGANHGAHLSHPDEFARFMTTAVGLSRGF